MKEQKFKVGQKVTFKYKRDCYSSHGDKGYYGHGGVCQGGRVGRIVSYNNYNSKHAQHSICVSFNRARQEEHYNMYENEFIEYDEQPSADLFPIY